MCHAKRPTMKKFTLVILMLVSTMTCFGQTLFFDNLKSSIWTSSLDISDFTLKTNKEIPLAKLVYARDSISRNVSIWNFTDNVLTIVKYDYKTKTENLIGSYKYAHDEKGILKITLQDNTELNYKVGIASTGSYAVLIRTKQKRWKNKK